MQGLRSKNPAILPLDTEIEQTIRQKPRDNVEEEEELQIEEAMAEQNINQRPPKQKPIKQYFIHDNPNQMVYKFNCTRQLHESIVIEWMCKCECRTHRESAL
jgi:hypothetical protein